MELRASVSNSLGDLPDVALPAFVASRILSRPLVVTMVDHVCAAIGASRQTIMAEYDTRTDEALSRLASTLPTATALDLARGLRGVPSLMVLSGSEPAMRDQPSPAPRHARGITPDDGDGDDEHPHTRKRTKIHRVIDLGVREGLLQTREGEGSPHERVFEKLSEEHDLVDRHLDADEHVDSVRFRLGCVAPRNPSLAPPATLAIWTRVQRMPCCALGEATRGHNAVSCLRTMRPFPSASAQ